MSPTQISPPTGPGDGDIGASLGRMAATMPTDQPDLAFAAMREATAIRRRQRGLTVAGVAAAIAIAVPVAWQVGRPGDPVPITPAHSQVTSRSSSQSPTFSTAPTTPTTPTTAAIPGKITAPATASPTPTTGTSLPTRGTTQGAGTAPVTVGGSHTGRAALGPVSRPEVIVPYLAQGTYHGSSGTRHIAESRGATAALALAGGNLYITINTLGPEQHAYVQDRSGRVLAHLPLGFASANKSGDRFALVDPQTSTVRLYDASGTQLKSIPAAGNQMVAGFRGTTVFLTPYDHGPTTAWNTATGTVTTWSERYMIAANDTTGRALLQHGSEGTDTCWEIVRSSDGGSLEIGCGTMPVYELGYDGATVIGIDSNPKPGAVTATVTIPDTGTSLAVTTPAGQSVVDAQYSLAHQELVLTLLRQDGPQIGMVACRLDGTCRPIAAPITEPSWPEMPAPYVLVHG